MGLNVSGSSIPPPGWWKKYAVLVAAVVGALLALDFLVSWVRFGVFAAQAASPGAPAELFVSVLDTIIYHRTADRLEDFYVQTRLWSLGQWVITRAVYPRSTTSSKNPESRVAGSERHSVATPSQNLIQYSTNSPHRHVP